jgi:hypothetical protein
MGCRLRGWPAGVSLVALLGCNAYDPDLLQEFEGSSMRPVQRNDAAPPCSRSGSESCNGADDDCDGKVDEGAESECLFPHATSLCVTPGECVIVECAAGYADCNRELSDGCEQRASEIACGMCGKVCPGSPENPRGGSTSRPDDGQSSEDEDAGTGMEPPACSPSDERCDDLDNDCDGNTDEGTVCAVAQCKSTAPSYRGDACDQCVCEQCPQLVALCQNHPDATWAQQCRALVECVVIESRMGTCQGTDCYIAGAGPCADETHTAAGGSGPAAVAAACAGGTAPPASACAGAVNYRDRCTTTSCSSVCTQ